MLVRDAMTPHPVAVAPEDSIETALIQMRRGRFRHLPVVAGGALAGVLTERDLHGSETPRQPDRPVRSVMTVSVITIGPDDPVEQAARLMLENKVGCLPVVENGTLTGIITESDIFRAFVTVLGVMEPGTRVQIDADDLAAALESVVRVARSRGVRLVSVVSERGADEGSVRLVVRFGTLMVRPLVEALRADGLDVDEPHRF
jgi:acetoin utilization protein AcuB